MFIHASAGTSPPGIIAFPLKIAISMAATAQRALLSLLNNVIKIFYDPSEVFFQPDDYLVEYF